MLEWGMIEHRWRVWEEAQWREERRGGGGGGGGRRGWAEAGNRGIRDLRVEFVHRRKSVGGGGWGGG